MILLQKYKVFFVDTQKWAFRTALALFVLYLALFLGICFWATLLPNDESFKESFEKYFVSALGIYQLCPFALSVVLIYFTLNLTARCLLIWLKIYIPVSIICVLVTIAGGLYVAVKGTLYIGITLIVLSVLLAALKSHTTLIVAVLYENEKNDEETESRNSSNKS